MTQESAFALHMYRALALASKGKNIFFSPVSISTCFGLVYEGASGETLEEMRKVFQFSGDRDQFRESMLELVTSISKGSDNVTLTMANKMYADNAFRVKAEYASALAKFFSAEDQQVDFKNNPEASRQLINTWVADKTNQKIKDLIPGGAITPLTVMVLANAIYFKGLWESQFKSEHTRDGDFHLSSTTTVQTPMMYQETNVMIKDDPELGAQIIQVPYKGREIFFTVVLPTEVEGLESVVEKLTAEKLSGEDGIFKNLRRTKVHLHMPKFRVEYSAGLKDHLTKMGVQKVFDADTAELRGIAESGQQLYVSEAFHKAFVEVNEEGTEAAAATGMVIMMMSMPLPSPHIHLDRPFLYTIGQKDRIYFMGSYVGPVSA